MLLINIVCLQFNIVFPSLYRLGETRSIEAFVGITQKLWDMLLNILVVLKLNAFKRFFQWFKQVKITCSFVRTAWRTL